MTERAITRSYSACAASFALNDSEARELLLSGFSSTQRRVDEHLRSLLRLLLHSQGDADSLLLQGMRAGLLEGGKRIRPFLLFASAQLAKALAQKSTMASTMASTMELASEPSGKATSKATSKASGLALHAFAQLGAGSRLADDAAAALELVHSYSLVHDDLPAMDGDLLRRGKPTMHVRFGEGQAVLVGDALLTLAFEVLATTAAGTNDGELSLRLALSKRLAVAAGIAGMAGGQSLDLLYADERADSSGTDSSEADSSGTDNKTAGKAKAKLGNKQDEELVRLISARKTGALLRASCAMGALCEGASAELCAALEEYGRAIGEAYQIVDDLCDFSCDFPRDFPRDFANSSSSLSSPTSPPPCPAPSPSPCYVRAVGKAVAEDRVRALCLAAEASILEFGDAALPLVLFTRFLPSRMPAPSEPPSESSPESSLGVSLESSLGSSMAPPVSASASSRRRD